MTQKELETAVNSINFNDRPIIDVIRDYCAVFLDFKRSQADPVDVVEINEDDSGRVIGSNGKEWTDDAPELVYANLAQTEIRFPQCVGYRYPYTKTQATAYYIDWTKVTVDDMLDVLNANSELDCILQEIGVDSDADKLDPEYIEDDRATILKRLDYLFDIDNNNGACDSEDFDITGHWFNAVEGNDYIDVSNYVEAHVEKAKKHLCDDEMLKLTIVVQTKTETLRRVAYCWNSNYHSDDVYNCTDGKSYYSPFEGMKRDDAEEYAVYFETEEREEED